MDNGFENESGLSVIPANAEEQKNNAENTIEATPVTAGLCYCNHCGEPLIAGKMFCANCGQSVKAVSIVNETVVAEPATTGDMNKIKLAIGAIVGTVVVAILVFVCVLVLKETPATSLMLDESMISIPVGNQTSIHYQIEPEKAEKNKLTWTSSDSNVATVSDKGAITAVNPGTCVITVTTKNDITASIAVTVGAVIDAVKFRDVEVNVKEEETATMVCTVSPSNAYDKTITWESSNTTVAEVNEDGVVMGVSEGTCVITATTVNGLSDTCVINVQPGGPNFSRLYFDYCDSPWAEVADDGSFLKIDTNPYDVDEDDFTSKEYGYMLDGMEAIENINADLSVPESVVERMQSTTALQGLQTADYDTFTISWTYHPDNGLEVMYEIK